MSRNTTTKYLNVGTIEPQFMTPERQSKLDPFAEKLTGWNSAALRCGTRSRLQHCPGVLPKYGTQSRPR